MSEIAAYVQPGDVVRTTRELLNRDPDRPELPAGKAGIVDAVYNGFAFVEFEPAELPDGEKTRKTIPLSALELVERPANLAAEWDLIVACQRYDPIEIISLEITYEALSYRPVSWRTYYRKTKRTR